MMAESSKLDEAATYTMKLRSGLTWSDGSPVTARTSCRRSTCTG